MKAATLTGVQKVAVLMMDLGEETASQVMRHFTQDETEQVAAEIMRMRVAEPDVVDQVMAEMAQMVDSGRVAVRGGESLARALVSGAFGADMVSDVMGKAEGVLAGRAFEFMEAMDPAQIRALIGDETVQTIALVLSNLDHATTASVLAGMEHGVRNDVAIRIAKMSTPSAEAVQATAEVLKSRSSLVATAREQAEVGGVPALVEIINRADSATEKALLAHLDETDPEMAAEVRELMFTFPDLIRLEIEHLRQVVRKVRVDVLAKALKGADPELEQKIRSCMTSRNQEDLDEALQANRSLRTTDQDEARSEVVRKVRELESEGVLDLSAQEVEYV